MVQQHLAIKGLDVSMVNENVVAQFAAKTLSMPSDADASFKDYEQTVNQVKMIFTAIGKFVAFMFRKTHYETVIADIFGLGNFIRNCTIGKIGVT